MNLIPSEARNIVEIGCMYEAMEPIVKSIHQPTMLE